MPPGIFPILKTRVDYGASSVISNQYQETLQGETTGGVKGLHEAGLNAVGSAERSPMWLLIIVLLNIVPGLEKITVLNTFATSEECQSERNRIAFEMAAAYPNDRDFVIACRLNPKHGS